MKKHPQDLHQLWSNAKSLPLLAEKAELLMLLNHQVKQMLPKHIVEHINVANLRQNSLIIDVSSAAWATRVKMQQKALLMKLQDEFLPSLIAIEIKINPNIHSEKAIPTVKHRQLSANAAEHLNALANQIDGPLAVKLKRLAALASR